MTTGRKEFPVSWEELHRYGKALAWRLLEFGPFKGIVAITRGGLVPAAIVARELDVRLIETVCIASYGELSGTDRDAALSDSTLGDPQLGDPQPGDPKLADRAQGSLTVLKRPDVGDGSGWLIVDDLVDTGQTARAVRELMPKAHFATIYAKPAGRPLVDTFITEVSQDTWIMFPWDIEPQFIQPIARRNNKA